MPVVPWWALASSAGAPVFLIGGWTLAAARQPPGFDSRTETISALASYAATDRWLMTLALGAVGAAHLVTAAGLRPAAPAGRLVLAVGGLTTLGVAATPLPAEGSSTAHGIAAAGAFVALAAWPALAWRRGDASPRWPLHWRVCLPAAAVLLGLDGWLAMTLRTGTDVGLAERVAAGAQALWPLVVVSGLRWSRARGTRTAGRLR